MKKNLDENPPTPLLTIGIPTYNRAKFIPELLQNLEMVLEKVSEPVEVIFGDNSDDDITMNLVLGSNLPHLTDHFKYIKNSENLGFQRNLENLVNVASGKYFIWIGDDDLIVESHFTSLIEKYLKHLQIDCLIYHPKAINPLASTQKKFYKGFYFYGNAWMSITKTEILQKFNNESKLIDCSNVWYQTYRGYASLIAHGIKNSKVIFHSIEYGEQSKLGYATFFNASYFSRSNLDLVLIASSLDFLFGTKFTKKFCSIRNPRFLYPIYIYTSRSSLGESISILDYESQILTLLKKHNKNSYLFAKIAFSQFGKFVALVLYLVSLKLNPVRYVFSSQLKRNLLDSQIDSATKNDLKMNDWFD